MTAETSPAVIHFFENAGLVAGVICRKRDVMIAVQPRLSTPAK